MSIGKYHNEIVLGVRDQIWGSNSINGAQLINIYTNYVNSRNSKYDSLFHLEYNDSLVNKFVDNYSLDKSDVISYADSVNMLLLDHNILTFDEKTLIDSLVNYVSNYQGDNFSSGLNYFKEYYLKHYNVNQEAEYSQIYIGILITISENSYELWSNWDNTNYSIVQPGDSGFGALNGPPVTSAGWGDFAGAIVGTVHWFYDNWDCLDWGCYDDTGKRLGRSALGWGTAGSGIGGGFKWK